MRRPWKVTPGFRTGRGGLTFDNAGTGIPCRSFATESAARLAAIDAVTCEAGGQSFAAVRLYCVTDDGFLVDEYESRCEGRAFSVRRRDILAEIRERCP